MAMAVVSWGVSPTDVANITGASATPTNIAIADSIVSIVANRTAAASGGMSDRDIYWVQAAICWQARWIPSQPDLLGRADFDSISQDGISVQSAAKWAKYLAPMAARSLKNLSTKGARTEKPGRVEWPTGAAGRALFLLEEGDDYTSWQELDI